MMDPIGERLLMDLEKAIADLEETLAQMRQFAQSFRTKLKDQHDRD